MTKERIEELIAKKRLTANERAEVRAAADELGIKYTIKQGCRTCYEKIMTAIYEKTDDGTRNISRDGWMLKRKDDNLRVMGMVINDANISTLTIGNLHPAVLSQFFMRAQGKEE